MPEVCLDWAILAQELSPLLPSLVSKSSWVKLCYRNHSRKGHKHISVHIFFDDFLAASAANNCKKHT